MNDKEKIQLSIDMIIQHGGHDGEHHKTWCLDQVFKILVGNDYEKIVSDIRKKGWEWDEGIAP